MERATFVRDEAMLLGAEAVAAWRSQVEKCQCGRRGNADDAVCGSVDDMPATWLGCSHCGRRAVGWPLVFRTASQVRRWKEDVTVRCSEERLR